MEALGEQLSAARKKLGLGPAQAAACLHIRTALIEAMERENWSVVGAPVYVRGFLRNYAKLLGIDPQAAMAALPEEQLNTSPVQLAETSPVAALNNPMRNARWYPWVLGALTVIAGVLVVNVAIALFGISLSQPKSANVAPSIAMPTVPVEQMQQTTSNTLQAAAAAQSQGGVNLRLQLTQPSWLSITVDGKRVVYETLPAGTIRIFHGAREISMRAGNAGGVVANFDGKDLGTLGTAGQVEDRVFAAKTPTEQMTGTHE
jgi:cytoskeleton protein RodZ